MEIDWLLAAGLFDEMAEFPAVIELELSEAGANVFVVAIWAALEAVPPIVEELGKVACEELPARPLVPKL